MVDSNSQPLSDHCRGQANHITPFDQLTRARDGPNETHAMALVASANLGKSQKARMVSETRIQFKLVL